MQQEIEYIKAVRAGVEKSFQKKHWEMMGVNKMGWEQVEELPIELTRSNELTKAEASKVTAKPKKK